LFKKQGSLLNEQNLMKSPQMPQKQVLSRIYGHGRGWVFTPNSFQDAGTPQAVGNALRRLTRKGLIQRIGRGLYYYPKKHHSLGLLSPPPDSIAKALAGRAKARLLPSGAYAANILGLSEQVPAKITFLTDAPSKKVRVGKQVIELRQTAIRNMATADRTAGLVIQALRYLGQNNITPEILATLRQKLDDRQKKAIRNDLSSAPSWMVSFLGAITQKY
jgi:Family of unknown function (DUF6088)